MTRSPTWSLARTSRASPRSSKVLSTRLYVQRGNNGEEQSG